jgi:hypothetical protein
MEQPCVREGLRRFDGSSIVVVKALRKNSSATARLNPFDEATGLWLLLCKCSVMSIHDSRPDGGHQVGQRQSDDQ